MSRLIALTTDFGWNDEYVGVMKGVIIGVTPSARILDLSHDVEPQNIAQAAYLIHGACRFFPDQTIHVVVVDPGVGTSRRLVLVGARKQLFLAPDNGVLSLLLNDEDFSFARVVANEKLFIRPVSRTFHGRDILAPVAAHLAAGLSADAIGPPLGRTELTILPLAPSLAADGKWLEGRIVQVDRFGNLLTNIDRHTVEKFTADNEGNAFSVIVGGRTITRLADCYAEGQAGGLLALFGSREYLEIAINQGHAGKFLGVSTGEVVSLRTNPKVTLYSQPNKY